MFFPKGTDDFKDGRFSRREWSAPVLHTPEEVLRAFRDLRLEGRVVRDLIAVGIGYTFGSDIDDYMNHALDALPAEAFAAIPDPDAPLPKGLPLPCRVAVDEPLLVCFADGDVLAIAFDFTSSVQMSLNTIPPDILPGPNGRTFHAGRLFADLLGKRLSAINITFSTRLSSIGPAYGLDRDAQSCFVTRVELVFTDDRDCNFERRLCFYCEEDVDFGCVELMECDRVVTFPAERLPWVCEGYLDEYFLTGPST